MVNVESRPEASANTQCGLRGAAAPCEDIVLGGWRGLGGVCARSVAVGTHTHIGGAIPDLMRVRTAPYISRHLVVLTGVLLVGLVVATVVLATTFREVVIVESLPTSQFDLGPLVGTYSQSFRAEPVVLTGVSVFVAHVDPADRSASIAFRIRDFQHTENLREGRLVMPARASPGWIKVDVEPLEITGGHVYQIDVSNETTDVELFVGGGIRDRYPEGSLIGPDGLERAEIDIMFRLHATYGPVGLVSTSVQASPIGMALLTAIATLGAMTIGLVGAQHVGSQSGARVRLVLVVLIGMVVLVIVAAATYRLTEVA